MAYTRILVRRGTASDWTTSNPILATGEFGFESNTGKFKIGNGSSNWSALEYFSNDASVTEAIVGAAPEALNTLNEIATALDNDPDFATTLVNQLALKADLDSPTFSGTVDFSNATVSGVMLPINWMGEFSDTQTYAENDVVIWSGSSYYATGPNLNNVDGYYPTAPGADWELFVSQGEVGPAGPQGPVGPAPYTIYTSTSLPSAGTGLNGDLWVQYI